MFKKDELRLLWPFYLYFLIWGLSMVIVPYMIIYFRNLGFSFLQISIITSAFTIGMFFFEVPTGAFADSYSRKRSVLLGMLISGTSLALVPIFDNFYFILFLWLTCGFGFTFISGAEDAWVVDYLKKKKKEKLTHDYFIKNQTIMGMGAIISPLFATLLVKYYSMKILWPFFGVGIILSAIILAIFAKEYSISKERSLIKAFKEIIINSKKGFYLIKSNNFLLYFFLGLSMYNLFYFTDQGWQPFLVSLSMSEYKLGIVFSALAVFRTVIPLFSKKLDKFDVENVMITILAIMSLLYLGIYFIVPPFYIIAAAVMILVVTSRGLVFPLTNKEIHKHIPSKIRATVVSTKSMFESFLLAIFGLIGGKVLDIFGMRLGLSSSFIFGLIAIFLIFKAKTKEKKNRIVFLKGGATVGKSTAFRNLKKTKFMKNWHFIDHPELKKQHEGMKNKKKIQQENLFEKIKGLIKTKQNIILEEMSPKTTKKYISQGLLKKYNYELITFELIMDDIETAYQRDVQRVKNKEGIHEKVLGKRYVLELHKNHNKKRAKNAIYINTSKLNKKQVVKEIIKNLK